MCRDLRLRIETRPFPKNVLLETVETVTLSCEKKLKNHMETMETVNTKIGNSDFQERCRQICFK